MENDAKENTPLLSVALPSPNNNLSVNSIPNCNHAPRRDCYNQAEWRCGLLLALLSGVLFTANNLFIQILEVDPLEMLLVRSIVQSLVLGIVAADYSQSLGEDGREKPSVTSRFCAGFQGLLGGLRLLLNFACLSRLPLGDALTLIFSEPLFTVVLSALFHRGSGGGLGVTKVAFCVSLVTGMLLCVQPPSLFGEFGEQRYNHTDDDSVKKAPEYGSDDYFAGAAMAVACALCGALCNVFISRCQGFRSTVLVFYTGLAGVAISVAGCLVANYGGLGVAIDQTAVATEADGEVELILENMESLNWPGWASLLALSALGVTAYFSMTEALRCVSPTSVSVVRALEIIMAYGCQIAFLGEWPNILCAGGAALVMASVVGIALDEKNRRDERTGGDPYEGLP